MFKNPSLYTNATILTFRSFDFLLALSVSGNLNRKVQNTSGTRGENLLKFQQWQ